jgi:SNF2 family DNA or RNA helicase
MANCLLRFAGMMIFCNLSPGGRGWSRRLSVGTWTVNIPNATAFNERYGRIETRITEHSGGRSEDYRMSRGSKNTIKTVRRGIMPPLFGRHLIDKCVFLSLHEVAENVPPLVEECIPIRMDQELAVAYRDEVQEPLVEAIKEMMKRRDRRLLGAMVQTLLAYPDHPFGWQPVGYWKSGQFITVAIPPNLADDIIRPKEQVLIDLVRTEKIKPRQVWVFVQFTDKHDVEVRLDRLLTAKGLRVGVLRSSVPLARREEWITENAPRLDVVISHPRLVETGLDLFDKGRRHNFPTICFYETGYNLFTLRQASRRSWRIGQSKDCRVVYLYYEGTMQDRAIALMGKKLTAAETLEGKFSTDMAEDSAEKGMLVSCFPEGIDQSLISESLISDSIFPRLWTDARVRPSGENASESSLDELDNT